MNDATPIRYSLRVSPRARQARLQVKPFGGLEIVIPRRFPRREVPRLVEQHAGWIRRQLEHQARLRAAVRLPDAIRLAFDDSITGIEYARPRPGTTPDLFTTPCDNSLRLQSDDFESQLGELRQWIRARAEDCLPPLLQELSRQTGLVFKRVSIRSQKTRWGSCSARGNISLNDQLLFLPRASVEYLMIHELCHLRHLNHSRAYWQLVAQHCPDYRQHEDRLSQPRDWVPDWYLLTLFGD